MSEYTTADDENRWPMRGLARHDVTNYPEPFRPAAITTYPVLGTHYHRADWYDGADDE